MSCRKSLSGATLEFDHTANLAFAHPELPAGCNSTGELFQGVVSTARYERRCSLDEGANRRHGFLMTRRCRIARTSLATLVAGSLACAERAAPPSEGTRRMADTLAFLYAQAVAQPERYEFLNRDRVAMMQARIVFQQRNRPTLQDRYMLARERLLAGQTREAIAELESLRRASGLTIDAQLPQNKAFFDLLGIAYLRLGEQENCNLNPNTSVCVLGKLRHTHEEGARQALALYQELLRSFPDDHGFQWLLNIAYMAVGEYPSAVPARYLIPNLTVKRDTTFPVFFNVAQGVGAAVNGLAGGLCVEDFNRDGLLDLFTTGWGLNDPVHFLVADGQGGYVDRALEAGLEGIVGGPNCTHADYDNDGDEDIFIVRGAWLGDGGAFPNSLLCNRGDGTFEDVTFAAGVGSMHPTHTAAWADFNLDGFLDLFVGNESGVGIGWSSHPSELFLNNRDGTFTNVARKVGIDLDAFVKGSAWGDINNDGLPDLFVSVFGAHNRLYLNRGGSTIDRWRFDEVAATAGTQLPIMSFPTWFWDFDHDGWEDLLVLSYDNRAPLHAAVAREYLGLPAATSLDHTHLYRNRGDGTFEDVSDAAGLADKAIYAMGSNFGDIDNDGWLDFYLGTGNPDLRSIIPNRMFRGVDGRRFAEITAEGGFGHLQKGHGTAFADLDRDGDEDVFMVLGGAYAGDTFPSVLFENPGWRDRNWITLILEGRSANRSAIGARVEIVAAGTDGTTRTLRRTIGTGGSFGVGSLHLHVGIGSALRVPLVRVTWPDSLRSTSSYPNLRVRSTYLLVQGQALQMLDRSPVPFRHATTTTDDHDHTPRN